MAQMLLNYQCSKDVPSLNSTLSVNESGTTVNKGTSSILRKLRYRTGKLNTNISYIFKECKEASEKCMNESQKLNFVESDSSSSCDDPDESQSTSQTEAKSQEINSDNNKKRERKKRKKGFSCEVCGHVASSSQRLKEHLSRHSGKKHLECGICGKKFAWSYSFKSHMASHMENNPNKCTICEKKYCNKSSVKNHMIRVHGNPNKNFKCDKCEKSFMTKAELGRHSFNHTKEKPYVCEFCGNSYRFKGALSVHYRVHSGEKPYKCEFCEKEFIHLSSVIGHRRRHTGEKPFQCKECGKTFRVKRAMTSHMSVHSKEGKFKCDECGKTFKSRSGYRVHLDYHLGIKRHSCKYCGRTFRAWCNMHKHMRRHLGEKPHICELCGKTFIEKQELKNHMKSHINNSLKQKKISLTHNIINSDDIMPPPSLTSTSCDLETSVFVDADDTDIIPNIDITDNEVIYDCNMSNPIDKCAVDKCQLLQDNYVSQFLYPQHPTVQYVPQPVPMQNIFGNADPDPNVQRSACLSNINSVNFNCVQLNNQTFNTFPYNLPSPDELLSKCKLCRSLFHSTLVLRSHMLEYHRIDEENVDELLT